MRSREDLAWAAGLFEGEGCFSGHNQCGLRSVCASVRMTDEDVVRRLQQVLGVGAVNGPYRLAAPRKPQWQWSVQSFEGTQAVGAMLWPWLATRRRARFKAIIATYHAHPIGGRVAEQSKRHEAILKDLRENVFNQVQIARFHGVSPALVTLIKQEMP